MVNERVEVGCGRWCTGSCCDVRLRLGRGGREGRGRKRWWRRLCGGGGRGECMGRGGPQPGVGWRVLCFLVRLVGVEVDTFVLALRLWEWMGGRDGWGSAR